MLTKHSELRWIYTVAVFVRFFTFLLLRKKVCAFSFAFLYVHIRTNQTVTYGTKVFRKIFFIKGYSSILKYRSYRSHTKFLNKIKYLYITVYLVVIWTYKNVDKKAHTFSRRCENVKKRTKNGYCVNSSLNNFTSIVANIDIDALKFKNK